MSDQYRCGLRHAKSSWPSGIVDIGPERGRGRHWWAAVDVNVRAPAAHARATNVIEIRVRADFRVWVHILLPRTSTLWTGCDKATKEKARLQTSALFIGGAGHTRAKWRTASFLFERAARHEAKSTNAPLSRCCLSLRHSVYTQSSRPPACTSYPHLTTSLCSFLDIPILQFTPATNIYTIHSRTGPTFKRYERHEYQIFRCEWTTCVACPRSDLRFRTDTIKSNRATSDLCDVFSESEEDPPDQTITRARARRGSRLRRWVEEQQTAVDLTYDADVDGYEPPSHVGTPSNAYLAYPQLGGLTLHPTYDDADTLHSYVILEEDELEPPPPIPDVSLTRSPT